MPLPPTLQIPSPVLRETLYAALRAKYGLLVRTKDFLRLRQALYAARTRENDPVLRALAFVATGAGAEFDGAQLAIVKVSPGGAKAQEEQQ